ncbi:uroporphyrin-III C-methyltransferase [Desulfofarcimen acetoxidans DSM 771]|jgi:uroporphyrinogen III methyltransferase/synthase|uniref:uroporphyrinogen-III C-methyltransferase n=1 Tax=Desulfofarcimen acetoxidans (strain ATCC 49208 / DSM 771 / KCTC 5769 / VKM B-1644 / 5575) TaxID=485916 RepID=C8W5F2_DESAS|nr:uroporphyrinogen-III C-methyltransferase [Desulfofarcimen acetoxidans]ACV62134.1 uroporphyrin-III C-methyltransferase [Desulfofarcimen acetoxidans DSM 771]
MKKGIVYLIGAGPGDPKLITVRGVECIKKADVVVYDRLAGSRLLGYAAPHAEMIYVGKSPDRHTLRQEEINQLLVKKAAQGLVVARLKGGDPFVFGRGGEEAEVLVQNSIPFEVVPGITSAIAVPAYAGIPVTHRDCTSTLAIITGNEDPAKEDSSIAWDKIATAAGTLVFLMGMGNLPKITDRLMGAGRPASTPVALIRWGTRPEQRTLTGTLEDIADLAKQDDFKNPAIIIVGEVVKLREKLAWFENKPLFGKRIVVTRSREQASVLSEAIEALGGESWEFPAIKIEEPEDYTAMDSSIENIVQFDWLIFTSVNGVKYYMDRLKQHKKDIRELKGIRLCAIGPKTKESLEQYGLLVDYVPGEYRAEQIIEGLKDKVSPGTKVLLARADIARKVLPEALRELKADVTEVVAYRTLQGSSSSELLKQMLVDKEIDAVTFTSSSTVRNFVDLLGKENRVELLNGVVLASIGPVTSQTAVEMGLNIDIEAKEYTINGLVQELLAYFQ